MSKFIIVKNPLRPLSDFAPIVRFQTSPLDFIQSEEIDMENKILIVDNEKLPRERWGEPVSENAIVIITHEIGVAAIVLLVVAVALAVAVYFFLEIPQPINADQQEGDSAYTLRGQKNQIRLGEAVEKCYGKTRHWPNYMAKPYNQFIGNDQYLFALLCVGLGKYNIHQINVEDTAIENFEDIEFEIYEPGESVTLFPTNVQTSTEVQGVEMFGPNEAEYESWIGPFAAVEAGSKAYRIEIDISCRQGLYRIDSKGKQKSASVTGEFQYRKINDSGEALGSWLPLVAVARTLNSQDPQRMTFGANVSPGRYEVRGVRTNNKSTSYKYRDTLHWEGLRTFCESTQNFGNVTLLAIKARASNNLNDSSKSAFNVISTSILPIYDLETGEWTDTETRNPIWAFCDIIRAGYGRNITTRFLDMQKLSAVAAELESEAVTFDWVFDQKGTVWAALQTVLTVARCVPVVPSGLISVVRDEETTIPTLGFNAHNIVKDSLSVMTKIANYGEHDGLEVEYINQDTWDRETAICLLDSDKGLNLKQIKLPGCTNRNFAYRWGLYQRAVELYQTDNIVFETGMEGATAAFGDLIAIRHETIPSEFDFVETESGRLPGDAFTVEGGFSVVQLSTAPTFEPGETYRLSIRDKQGVVRGPYQCTQHLSDSNKVVLEVLLTESNFEVGEGEENPLYWFGISGRDYTLAKIVKMEPSGSDNIKITSVIYDSRLYQFDELIAPPIGSEFNTPEAPGLPEIENLIVTQDPESLSEVIVSWKPAFGATAYIVRTSEDGANYNFAQRVEVSNCRLTIDAGTLWVKVQAVNRGIGPAATWTGEVGVAAIAPEIPGELALLEEFTGTDLVMSWGGDTLADSYLLRFYIGAVLIGEKSTLATTYIYPQKTAALNATTAGLALVRNLNVTVEAVNAIGGSGESAVVAVSNPVPAAPNLLTVGTPTGTDYPASWNWTPDDDFREFRLYASTMDGFTPGPGNLVGTSDDGTGTLDGAVLPLYWRVSALDLWGDEESMSDQATIPA